MKISNLLFNSFICTTLIGCSSMHHIQPTPAKTQNIQSSTIHKKKSPLEITFYQPGTNLKKSYTVIGEAIVSKFNDVGVKRQDAIIHDAMRNLAASMGGDAVIDLTPVDDIVVGKVITYRV